MFNISSNLTHNLALLAENTLISSATGLGALSSSLGVAGEGKGLVARALSKAASAAVGSISTAYTYGLPEGTEMAQSLERDYGIDPVTAATYGGAQAIITGMMESVLGIDKVLGSFNSPTMKSIAKLFDEDDLHALGLVGMTKNLIKNGFRDTFNLMIKMAVASSGSEAFQEGAEYLEGAGMKALAASVNSDMSFSEAWRREANAGDLWENMKQGGMMGFLLGMASADVGLMTGQTQIYDMAAHEAGRDAANRLLRADASNMTQEEALELLDLVAADMKANPTLLEDAAADYQAAMITADKIANGALTGVDAQFEAQISEAQNEFNLTKAAEQDAEQAFKQISKQQQGLEGALKNAANNKRRAARLQGQLKTATEALQTAKETLSDARTAKEAATEKLATLAAEKEASQIAAFEELRSRSASLVAQIRAEKQANAEEKARQEQERQQAIDNADTHPESQIAQTQAEVAEAERAVEAEERKLKVSRRRKRQLQRAARTQNAQTAETVQTTEAAEAAETAQATEAQIAEADMPHGFLPKRRNVAAVIHHDPCLTQHQDVVAVHGNRVLSHCAAAVLLLHDVGSRVGSQYAPYAMSLKGNELAAKRPQRHKAVTVPAGLHDVACAVLGDLAVRLPVKRVIGRGVHQQIRLALDAAAPNALRVPRQYAEFLRRVDLGNAHIIAAYAQHTVLRIGDEQHIDRVGKLLTIPCVHLIGHIVKVVALQAGVDRIAPVAAAQHTRIELAARAGDQQRRLDIIAVSAVERRERPDGRWKITL